MMSPSKMKAQTFFEFLNEAYVHGKYYEFYPEQKDYMRISDIIKKVDAKGGGEEKIRGLANPQAKSIDDPGKAMRRARAALEIFKGYKFKGIDLKDDDRLKFIAKFFLNRALELDVEESQMSEEEKKLVRGHLTAKTVGIV